MNADFKLQILHSGQIFDTSEEALKYIDKYLEDGILLAEAAVAFYGDDKDHPNVILCVGNGTEKNSVYTVDFQEIKDELKTLSGDGSANAEELAEAMAKIEGILDAVGLSCNEINGEWVVSYEPDPKDEVIGDAESVADALTKLSEYAQSVAEGSQFDVEDTDSIELVKENAVVKANLKISKLGETSITDDDDNIIGVFSDGVYAVAHLDYDDEKKTLTFTTSGYDANGDFKRDANKEVVNLGEHTLYEEYNKGHNVEVTVDNDDMKISADVKISDNDNNILETKSDGLLVKGTASNIKYHNTTVREAINDLYDKVTDAAKKTEYNDSETIKFTTTTDSNDELNVTADVKLASNNSINVTDGGLNVNLAISINAVENTLTVKLGNTETTYDLPGVEIIDNIEFKDGNLVIHYGNGKEVTVPLAGLIAPYVFANDDSHTVHLDSDIDSSGVYTITASVKLRSSDNLIEVDDKGELYVSKETVEAIVSGVSDDIIERVKVLEEKVEALEKEDISIKDDIETLKEKVDTNTTNIQTNTDAISAIQTQMATDETSLKAIQAQVETNTANISANTSDIADIKTQIATDESNFSALAEQVKTNETNIQTNADAISALQDEVKEVESEIKLDEQTIESLTNEVKDVENTVAEVQTEVSTNTSNIATLTTRTDTLDEEVATLNADADTIGSVQHTVKVAKDIVEEELSTETTRATTAEEDLQSQIDNLSSQLSGDEESILAAAKEYTDKETERATAAEEALQSSVDTINGEIETINTEFDKKIETVVIEKVNDNNLQYQLLVDGKNAGYINIPEDAFLKDVSYDSEHKAIVFDFLIKDDEGKVEEKTVSIYVSDMVSDYTSGNGISIDSNVVSIHINGDANEKDTDGNAYLSLTEDGLALLGINEALALKADQSYVEEQVSELNERISTLEGTEYTAGNGIDITDLTISAKINDDANTEGYLKIGNGGLYVSGVNSAISEAVTSASDSLQSQIDENKSAIDILNSGVDTEGSVKNAIATAEAYTDEKVSDLESQISEVASELCDAGDGLKKVDIEGGHKFEVHINENSQDYLTVGEDGLNLKGVAGSDELSAVDERVKTIESDYATSADIKTVQDGVDANASAIEKLSDNFDSYKFHTADTSTVELTMKEVESEGSTRELSAKAVISSQAKNNIIDNGGLYSISEFNYNAATNVITFTNNNGEHEFTINSAGSLVVGGYYDSANHAVVLIVSDGEGETHEVSIPIRDLIYDIDVHNDVNDPVKLEITTDATTGAKVISATLEIANLDSNLIETNNGALYASNLAQDMYCINTEGTQQTIQQAISGFYSDITSIENALDNLSGSIGSTDNDLKELEEKVNTNTTDIAVLQGQVSTLTSQVTELQQQFGVVQQTVADMQECLGDICSAETSVEDRLTAIEEAIAQLIDFGSY